MKTRITNTSRANQGVWTEDGLVHIEPGESRTVTLAKDYVERARKLPFFTFNDPLDHDFDGKEGGSLRADPPSLSGKNKAELLDIAEAGGVEIADGATNAEIVSAIEASRAE
jgi:hypothetical protein